MIGMDEESLSEKVLIVSSNFMRARETAEIVHSSLKLKTPLRFDTRLHERNMGDLDMTTHGHGSQCHQIEEDDLNNPMKTSFNAESVISVAQRMVAIVQSLNTEFEGQVLVLVSHQDPLHILNALFVGIPLNKHRKEQKPQIGNCHIRELIQKTE